MEIEIDQLFDLPAHPLLVHVPVVLVPLALVVTIVALWPRLRRPAVLIAAGLAVVSGIGVVLATGSGESMQERVPGSERVEQHVEDGEAAEAPAVAFGIVAVAAAVVNEVVRRRSLTVEAETIGDPATRSTARSAARTGPVGWLAAGAVAVSLVVGVVATITVVQAGHSGADAVWHGTQDRRASGTGAAPTPDRRPRVPHLWAAGSASRGGAESVQASLRNIFSTTSRG